MGVFFCLFSFILIVELFSYRLNENDRSVRLWKTILYGTATWLVLALRSPQNGTDLVAYCARFPLFAEIPFTECLYQIFHWGSNGFEPGFVLLNKIITLFTTNVQVFLAVVSFLTILPISATIYKYSKSIFLSFIIFICFGLFNMCFTGLRQSLAFGITFWSIQFIIERKPLKFILALFLALSFHKSALFFGIMYFASKFNVNKQNAPWIFAGYVAILAIGAKFVFEYVTALFFSDKYNHYLQESDGAFNLALIYIVIFFWGLYSGYPKVGVTNDLIKVGVFLGMCIQTICIFGFSGSARMGFYFSILYCLYIPIVVQKHQLSVRVWMTPLIVILFILFYYLTTHNGTFNIVPYHFFWEPGYEKPFHFTF